MKEQFTWIEWPWPWDSAQLGFEFDFQRSCCLSVPQFPRQQNGEREVVLSQDSTAMLKWDPCRV